MKPINITQKKEELIMSKVFSLTDLTVINPNAPETLLLTSTSEILEEWNKFYSTYDLLFKSDETGVTASTWRETNIFLLLVDTTTQKICAIRDYGMYLPKATDFCFTTNFIPLHTHQPMTNVKELEEYATNIFSCFMSEVLTMTASAEYPLFLLEDYNDNNYLAWSIIEKKKVFVHGFKNYLPSFNYAETSNHGDIIYTKNDKYVIIPPSQILIDSLGLNLHPYVWNTKLAHDKWYPQKEKTDLSSVIDDTYHNLYKKALDVINQSRKNNLGHDDEFSRLESRVERFERLSELNAPTHIIEKEASLIRETYSTIKNSIL